MKNHRFPNLACMKISAYHKHNGEDVSLLASYDELEKYDKVFISKVFTDTPIPENILHQANVEYGGTGFFYDKAPPLPYDIEHICPDYDLYSDWVNTQIINGVKPKHLTYYTDYSIGFTTRGCIRQCSFCVNQNYKRCSLHSPVDEFLDPDRKYICLLDDNVFACPSWRGIFQDLNTSGKRFQFKQGLDERLLTDEKCRMLFGSRWIGDYIFAFDNIRDKDIIVEKLKMIRAHTDKIPKFYTFCGYNHLAPGHYDLEFWRRDIDELFERIHILMSYRCLPYVMRYADYVQSPYKCIYITAARWCNQPSMVKTKSFREFCEMRQDSQRYLAEFEKQEPAIADKYFDLKWQQT